MQGTAVEIIGPPRIRVTTTAKQKVDMGSQSVCMMTTTAQSKLLVKSGTTLLTRLALVEATLVTRVTMHLQDTMSLLVVVVPLGLRVQLVVEVVVALGN